MGDSLRDQLLKAGFKPAAPASAGRAGQSKSRKRHQGGEPDLAEAYAMRARAAAAERKQAKAVAEAAARVRKERKRRLQQVLAGKALNKADAERARHFEYGGKIRRVYVDAAQWAALNEGRLGIVQLRGGYVLVAREVAEQVRAFAPEHVALLVDPDAAAEDDDVPDDLTW